jgi:hypothetical protein
MLQRYVARVSYGCCKSKIGMLRLLQWLYTYVVNVSSQCFICFFRRMLQLCLSRCCICFHIYVASVLSRCCVCVAICFQVFFQVFLQAFQTYVLNVSSVFRRMLQVLYLDVSKVDRFGCCIFLLAFYCLTLVFPPRLSAALHPSQTMEDGPMRACERDALGDCKADVSAHNLLPLCG